LWLEDKPPDMGKSCRKRRKSSCEEPKERDPSGWGFEGRLWTPPRNKNPHAKICHKGPRTCWALMNTVMNLWVSWKAENLTSWATIRFSRRTLIHGVSYEDICLWPHSFLSNGYRFSFPENKVAGTWS
jgi:hypothetical protein